MITNYIDCNGGTTTTIIPTAEELACVTAVKEVCRVTCPLPNGSVNRWQCCRSDGHAGRHMAFGDTDTVYAAWDGDDGYRSGKL